MPPAGRRPASRLGAADRSPGPGRASGRSRRLGVSALVVLLLAAGVAIGLDLARSGPAGRRRGAPTVVARPARTATGSLRAPASRTPVAPLSGAPRAPFAVGLRTLSLLDSSRTVQLPGGGLGPRPLITYVRYPALGRPGTGDLPNAAPVRSAGAFPLIVFGHGFAVTPAPYARLLQSWASAGYVVAAPVFPLGSAGAPGGPNESDLVNQPADMSFVISSLLAGRAPAPVDPAQIAVAGQSDGGDTALAVAYDPRFRDRRVRAAVILAGAEIPFLSNFAFPLAGPALLATQGTADTVNQPSFTEAFFAAAHRPKYLLWLLRAEHLPPYTDQQPQLGIVERVTRAFLDGYLKGAPAALAQMRSQANVAGAASLVSEP